MASLYDAGVRRWAVSLVLEDNRPLSVHHDPGGHGGISGMQFSSWFIQEDFLISPLSTGYKYIYFSNVFYLFFKLF